MVESLLQHFASTEIGLIFRIPSAKLYTQLLEQQVSDEIAYRVLTM